MRKLAILLLLLAPITAMAANRFSVTSGVWNSTARWGTVCGGAGGSSIPVAADDVFICNGTTITLNISPTVDSVTINNGGTLSLSTFTLSIDNTTAFTLIAGGTLNAGTSTVRFFNPANTTLTTGTFTGANSFYNVTINPAPSGSPRTYTFGGAAAITNNFLIDVQSAGGAVRAVTVNLGGATTVTGLTTIQAGGNETANLVTNNNAFTTGRMNVGTAGTFTAGSSLVTLNGAVGPILTRTGTFTRGTSTVTMSPTASVALTSGTFTGANAFYNLTVNMPGLTGTLGAAIDLTGAGGVGGNLTLTAGTLADNGNAITSIAGGARTLSATANGALTLGTAAIATAFPTSFTTIALNAASTVTYNSNVAQAISATPVYGNLVLAATAAVVKTPSAGLNVDGNLTIGANNTLAGGALGHTLAGNFTNDGAFTTTGTLTLDGGAAQTIGGTTNTAFNNLTIANTVGGVSLTASQTVGGTLTLTSGTFDVGANTLTLNGPAIAGTPANMSTTSSSNLTFGGASAGVNLPSSVTTLNNLTVNNANGLTLNSSPALAGTPGLTLTSGAVVTGGNTLTASTSCPGSVTRTGGRVSGNLRMSFPAGTPNCTFHVGDATIYSPLTLNFSAVTIPGALTASASTPDHPNTTEGTSGVLSGTSVNRYWSLKDPAVAGTFTGTFTYVAGDNDALGSGPSYRVRRGANCAGTGSARTCQPWLGLAIPSSATDTQTVVPGISIAVSAVAEDDLSIGAVDPSTNFLREKQFIYTRELY